MGFGILFLRVKANPNGEEKMINPIEMRSEKEYFVKARGNEMTLMRVEDGWEMYTVNATVRAYNRGYAIPKFFPTLKDVEAKYKSWRGVASLVES